MDANEVTCASDSDQPVWTLESYDVVLDPLRRNLQKRHPVYFKSPRLQAQKSSIVVVLQSLASQPHHFNGGTQLQNSNVFHDLRFSRKLVLYLVLNVVVVQHFPKYFMCFLH